jgi:dihydroorotate dehydrogenase (NAD+) catalytic subunit
LQVNLTTDFAGISFKNPVVLASGTCGFGAEFAGIFDISKVGGICSKGITMKPLAGNDGIRIWETASGIMNSVGLENPGAAHFIAEELPAMRRLGPRVIVNLGGHSIDDYLAGAEALNQAEFDILDLNISCPNLKSGGMAFGVKAETARSVVREVRSLCRRTLCVKLSPNAEDIAALARACEEEGADGLSLVNTFLALAIDIESRLPVFDNIYAGLSGPAIKPIALRMVREVCRAVKIPVMGMGGVSSARDVLEFIMAGASLVQIGSANFMNPAISLEILAGLESWLGAHGIEDLEEIRGAVQ